MSSPESFSSRAKNILNPALPYHLQCRFGGLLNIGIAGAVSEIALSAINSANYPDVMKVPMMTYVGLVGAAVAVDGVGDIFKGVHHYLGLRAWQKFSRSQTTKDRIEQSIQNMVDIKDRKKRIFSRRLLPETTLTG